MIQIPYSLVTPCIMVTCISKSLNPSQRGFLLKNIFHKFFTADFLTMIVYISLTWLFTIGLSHLLPQKMEDLWLLISQVLAGSEWLPYSSSCSSLNKNICIRWALPLFHISYLPGSRRHPFTYEDTEHTVRMPAISTGTALLCLTCIQKPLNIMSVATYH